MFTVVFTHVLFRISSSAPLTVPYRDSILTRLLETTLCGNTHVTLITNIGPCSYNETFSTLLLGKRALCIKNNIRKMKIQKLKKCKNLLKEETKMNREDDENIMRMATRTPLVNKNVLLQKQRQQRHNLWNSPCSSATSTTSTTTTAVPSSFIEVPREYPQQQPQIGQWCQ